MKILIVEDEKHTSLLYKSFVEQKGECEIVEKGQDAIKAFDNAIAQKEPYDLILLDIIMPVEDGFTVAEQLKQDPQLAKIPVLMLTSYSTRGAETSIPRSRGFSLEAEDYIDKPVSPEELLAIVEKHLKRVGF